MLHKLTDRIKWWTFYLWATWLFNFERPYCTMCLWATWFVPLSSLTLYVCSGLKVYISLTCSLTLFLWAPDLYYWAGWLWNSSGLNERPLPHVDYLLMSSLNVYFLSGLCTFERSDFVHLSGLTMNIWSTWLWTFERPDYVPLSGLCTFERPGPMYCSWLSAPDGWPRTPKPELYWCHCPTAGWQGNWCHMWRQVFHRHHL